MANSQIKGIIFDLGSTLIEFESRSWDEMTYEGQKRAYDLLRDSDHKLPDFDRFNDRLEEIKNHYRVMAAETLKEWRSIEAFYSLLSELGLDNPEEQSRRCAGAFYNVVREGIVACEGSLDTLQKLKQMGIRTGLISNTIFPGREHDVDLDNLGLMPYIGFRLYSCDFGYRKPYPGIYEEGLRLVGLPAHETLFVGDRYYEDVDGPQKAGMSSVLVYHEGRDYPDPMPGGFPVINKLPELLELEAIQKRKE